MLERVLGEEELLDKVLRTFFQNVQETITLLEKAIADQDASESRLCAHSIKGAASTVSALALQETAKQMELAAAEGNIAGVKKRLSELAKKLTEFAKVTA